MTGPDAPMTQHPGRHASPPDGARRRRRRGGRDGDPVVPDVEFTSYYGRPVVKASPWQDDIPAYLFLGGLSAGSAVLGAGADLTGRPSLRRVGRWTSLAAITASFVALVHDLGRPERFVNMLRVAKPTSPMSVGTWILSGYSPLVGIAAVSEVSGPLGRLLPRRLRPLLGLLDVSARPAGVLAAAIAPAVASYTAVLLTDTATPAWNSARRELPFLFVSSAAAASGGMGMLAVPVDEAGPARRLALAGAVAELAVEQRMESSMGVIAETLHEGKAGVLMRASKVLTVTGAVASLAAGRSRVAGVVAGGALLAGSACTRFGIFEAGQASARDPKYTVVPQRARLDARTTADASTGPDGST